MLQYTRAALAQLVEFAFNAGTEHADQGGEDEDAADRDGKGDQAERPADIAADRAGIHGAHKELPGAFDEAELVAAVGVDTGNDEQRGRQDDDEDGNDSQPADQSDRAGRHAFVERITQALAQPIRAMWHIVSPVMMGTRRDPLLQG